MKQNNAAREEAQFATKDRYTAKALDRRKDVHAKFTDDGKIMIDAIKMSWDVKMVLAENGFHRQKEQAHGGFEVFA